MKLQKKINFRRWILLGIALLCIGLNLGIYALYTKNQQVESSRRRVDHTYQVIENANNLFFAVQDMQIALRGYLLTGDLVFLTPYHKAGRTIDEQFNILIKLTSDNPTRHLDLPELKKIVDAQCELMHRQRDLRQRTGGFAVEDMEQSKKLMDKIRLMNGQIIKDERRLLDLRAARQDNVQRNYMRSVFATAGISILALLIANAVIGFISLRRIGAEDDLRRINGEMEGFTYIASHDLRSPLVNLKGFSTEMAHGLKELEPIMERALEHVPVEDRRRAREILDIEIPDSLKFIHSSVEKMNRLTNGILELSRIGKRNLRIKSIDMRALAQRPIDALQHQISTHNIKVVLGEMPDVVSDTLSLEQVFGNILDNAIKYRNPARGLEIEIGGAKGRRQTTFWVKDNGRGIAPGDLEKIFEIYRRAGSSAHIPGEGMGMAYVRTTLRRLGGRIWVESVVDRGSIFYFSIGNMQIEKLHKIKGKEKGKKDA